MILSTHGFVASSIGQIDPDYLAFYNRVIAGGGSLTTTEQSATDQLVKDLKGYGIWSKMKAIYPMVGGGGSNPLQAINKNLKSSSFSLNPSSGNAYSSLGITPGGYYTYIFTSLVFPSSEKNDCSVGIYQNTNINNNGCAISNDGSGGLIELFPRSSNNLIGKVNDNNTTTESNSENKGFYQIERVNSTDVNFYKNGNSLGTNPKASNVAATITTNQIILGANQGGAANWSSNRIAFAFIGNSLGATMSANYYTAVQAFQTTLNRQV